MLLHGSKKVLYVILAKGGNPDFFCHAEQVLRIFLVDPEINSG
ncbi:hypothetical protein [Rickettsia endosymbiont of Orchestes rusci]